MIKMKIREFMAQDHKKCDLLFAQAENAASTEDWEETGVLTGPTEMMRMEHDQMRTLFTEMKDALEKQQGDDFLGAADTLLILMQQHNIKEEQILYSMMDQRLPEGVSQWQQKFDDWSKQ